MTITETLSEWNGVTYVLDARTPGDPLRRLVLVKARSRPGAPFVCLTCLANACQHIRFVQQELAA